MKKLSLYQKVVGLILAGLLIILLSVWLIPSNFWQISPASENGTSGENSVQQVSLVINNGQDKPKLFLADFQAGMTAFDLLKGETEKSNLTLKTKSYDIGVMIETIGDKTNGEGSKYWLYYVNGQMPPRACDKEELKAGDKVEFKFAKSPF